MCVKIISGEKELEFNPSESLESQVTNANEVLVDYDYTDPRIDCFVNDFELMVDSGINCNFEIRVNANNDINGIRLERKLEDIKKKLEINTVIKNLTKFHADTDSKLCEISNICLGKIDEQ